MTDAELIAEEERQKALGKSVLGLNLLTGKPIVVGGTTVAISQCPDKVPNLAAYAIYQAMVGKPAKRKRGRPSKTNGV